MNKFIRVIALAAAILASGSPGAVLGQAFPVKPVRSSDLTERMTQLGMEPVGSTPEQFDAFVRSEIEKWAQVVKASGAKVD